MSCGEKSRTIGGAEHVMGKHEAPYDLWFPSRSQFGLIVAACGFEEDYDVTEAAGALSGSSEQGEAEGASVFDRYMIYFSVSSGRM